MSSGVVILGAGPAGVGAAYRLAKRGFGPITVIEKASSPGGNSGSFQVEGIWADYGSHRLHPTCDPKIMADIRELLGPDLLLRPRHGRIRLKGRWIHFPLRPLDLLLHLPPSFVAGVMKDSLSKPFRRMGDPNQESFASVLEAGLGPTICTEFYFPYARKIWGLAPTELSPSQAHRRVSGGSPSKILRKILNAVPGLKPANAGTFYYPRQGFGQIASCLWKAAEAAGVKFEMQASVTEVQSTHKNIDSIRFASRGTERTIATRHVWSTIPVNALVRSLSPSAPDDLLHAAAATGFQGMILIYLLLEQDHFTEFDAHYFPDIEIPITRLSEPKNYSASDEPRNVTLLCAELPCAVDSPFWSMTDEELGQLMRESLQKAGLPVTSNIRSVFTKKLTHAYPLYRSGYEYHVRAMDSWLDQFDNLLTFGRQGLFAHDNTHHALAMAYAAVDCLDENFRFHRTLWYKYRSSFESHVVED